ncbi:hypothetical protein [Streptomyces mirabilis]|uniref:Uncharacterized protein n=1 Tax=Streptomyces mirabilis TaxID=68239 RepID=A0ABU3V0C9_9ACTN|nr:hypothetical protein [Streptomyces mirabilis]MDU8999636.1 hypothetical protein [Streptomyces mirabilis]
MIQNGQRYAAPGGRPDGARVRAAGRGTGAGGRPGVAFATADHDTAVQPVPSLEQGEHSPRTGVPQPPRAARC